MRATFAVKREQNHYFHAEHYTRLIGPLHFHSHVEILWVKKGSVQVQAGDRIETVNENEMFAILNYEAHGFHSFGEGEFYNLFIPTFMCPEFMEAIAKGKAHVPVLRGERLSEDVLYAVKKLTEGACNELEQRGYIYLLMGGILPHVQYSRAALPPVTNLPERLLFYINEHYKEDVSVAQIAYSLGYTTHYISKTFRACFGMGVQEYVNTLRLKEAVLLMQDKEKTITACAMESGFSSLRTFYRVFAAEYGCSPKERRAFAEKP